MNPSTIEAVVMDKDLAEQALPGHGIPSQDPDPAAQQALSPDEAQRESGSALAGGGVVAGAVAGAAVGAALAGPVGVLVGSTVGVAAGALGGAAAGSLVKPQEPARTIPGMAEHEITRTGESGHEDLSR